VFDDRADWLVNHGVDSDVLVVGSAFGYLIEALLDRGVSASGADPSPWIWEASQDDEWGSGVKALTADSAIADLQGSFRWLIDEDAISSQTETGIAPFLTDCERLSPRIVHFVSPLMDRLGDSAITWKRLNEWATYAPHHLWVDRHTMETN
jgi:hypothetical protein